MDVNKVYNDYMAQYAQVVENYNKNQQQMMQNAQNEAGLFNVQPDNSFDFDNLVTLNNKKTEQENTDVQKLNEDRMTQYNAAVEIGKNRQMK